MLSYISFGLKGADAVKNHVKGAWQQSSQTWRASHGESFSTSCDTVCEEQTCNEPRMPSVYAELKKEKDQKINGRIIRQEQLDNHESTTKTNRYAMS